MSHDPLSDDEIEKLRSMLKQDDRVAWFWASLRLWGSWFAAIVAFAIAFREDFWSLMTWIFQGPPRP